MNAMNRTAAALAVFLGLACSATLFADTPGSAASGNATITVTTIGKKNGPPPPVSKGDLQLTVNKERKQVAGWEKGDSLTLAILIDDSLESDVANQWGELRELIIAQAPDKKLAA